MTDQILQELHAKGYATVDKFLDAGTLQVMNEFFETHRSEFGAAKIGREDQRMRNSEIRGDHTFWLDPLNPQSQFNKIFQFLNQFQEALNEKFYLGLKQYECHLAYYPQGTFYKKHLDRFESSSSRSVSFVFYLNQEWKNEDGGELVIYDKSGNTIDTIYPMPGTFICFLSDEFPHEVKAANKERRSLTGWMHNKIIY